MATFKKIGKKGQERWSVVFDVPGCKPRKQKRLSGFATKSEANLAHVAFLARIEDKKQPATVATTETVQEVFNSYLDELIFRVKESSYSTIRSNFKNQILPYIGKIELNKIVASDINRLFVELSKKGLAHSTKIKTKGFLTHFFNYCVANELVPANPCGKASKLKATHIKKEMSIWTPEQFENFIKVVDDILFKTFFSFLFLTGCRRGEALALTWNDLSEDVVKIRKTLGYHTINGGFSISSPKNYYSNRDIVLPKDLTQLLGELKQSYQQYEGFSDENYMFGNASPLPPETIRRKMKYYCSKCGLQTIRIHDFRHSHASFLISKNCDIVTIARRLGHADIEMTLNRYAHMLPNKQSELVKALTIKI